MKRILAASSTVVLAAFVMVAVACVVTCDEGAADGRARATAETRDRVQPRAREARTVAPKRLSVRLTVSDATPASGTAVRVTVRVRDRRRRAVRRARVRVTWLRPGNRATKVTRTDRRGVVRSQRRVWGGTGTIVRVKVTVTWRGRQVGKWIRLRPQGGGGSGGGSAVRLQPGDLVYRGAFRLPGESGGSSWEWSGDGLAYRPDGDPGGAGDGYPGSLFGIGHDWQHYLSEVTIPAPVVSADKDPADLPRARTLQPFADVRGDLYPDLGSEILRSDVEYLPAQTGQSSGKLYLGWGRHMQEGERNATHMWCETDLSDPRPAGPWSVGGLEDYLTCDYLFTVDPAWAAANTPGKLLATGRFRDGGQAGMGPSIFAIAPWQSGNPPAPGTRLPAVTLLRYDSVYTGAEHILDGYHHADEWSGAAWLSGGGKAAVVFAGTKGRGDCWYGFPDGTVWPDEPPYPPVPPEGGRGWWSSRFEGQLLFYDPADLAAVARGDLAADRPQPYAVLDLDRYLYHVTGEQQKYHTGALTFDRQRGRLFLIEPLADGDRSIVHVWSVE